MVADQFEDAVVGSDAQLHLLHSRFEEVSAGSVKRAKTADFTWVNKGVGLNSYACKPFSLNGAD